MNDDLSEAERAAAVGLYEVLVQEAGGPGALGEDGVQIVRDYCAQVVRHGLVFARKQHDYGPRNIAASGQLGVFVRLRDKMERLRSLRGRIGKNEPKADASLDIANYGVILSMLQRGDWPGVESGWEL